MVIYVKQFHISIELMPWCHQSIGCTIWSKMSHSWSVFHSLDQRSLTWFSISLLVWRVKYLIYVRSFFQQALISRLVSWSTHFRSTEEHGGRYYLTVSDRRDGLRRSSTKCDLPNNSVAVPYHPDRHTFGWLRPLCYHLINKSLASLLGSIVRSAFWGKLYHRCGYQRGCH